ncbi:MAG: hypothetical protein SV186_04945 [Candidatus Nanohaloarchaea archaeon]|nr:hypothetical protein [Candidatus Nanohaloarchaea archaeon]
MYQFSPLRCSMLPDQYGEGEADRYAGAVYVSGSSDDGAVLYASKYGLGNGPGVTYGDDGYGHDDRYGTGTDVGGERYGGGAAGGERYGVGALLNGDVDQGYGAVPVGDGRYVAPAGAVGYDAVGDERYPAVTAAALYRSLFVREEFGVELPAEWSDWEYS